MDLDLPAQILELDEARLQIHQQRRAQLILGPVHLGDLQAGEAGVERERLQLPTHDVDHAPDLGRAARGGNAEDAAVGEAVVEGDAALHPAVLVQDVGVEAGVHALSGPAGGEGTAPAEERLQRGEGVDVGGGDGGGFEG